MRSAPKLVTTMRESPLYQVMGVGLTDRIFLLGHSDGLRINDPYPVASVKEAVDALEANTDSPLLLAMLEAYFSGARDIWLMSVAPMEDYESELDARNAAYYEQYQLALNEAYDVLKHQDISSITIPVDAPFNSTVDFLGPLVNFCVEAHQRSGEVHLGMLGTRGRLDEGTINNMVNDPRLSAYGEAGKLVSVFAGDATFSLKELPFNHTGSVVPAIAGELSQLPLDRGLTYRRLRNVISIEGRDLKPEEIESLAQAGINPVGRNLRGRRGASFQVVPFTDNTLAKEGSDFWSLTQMRLVSKISADVHGIGRRSLGTIGLGLFREDMQDYLLGLTSSGVLRGYDLDIRRADWDKHTAIVELNLHPYYGVRELNVNIEVGPSLD